MGQNKLRIQLVDTTKQTAPSFLDIQLKFTSVRPTLKKKTVSLKKLCLAFVGKFAECRQILFLSTIKIINELKYEKLTHYTSIFYYNWECSIYLYSVWPNPSY